MPRRHDIDDELAFHLEMLVRRYVAEGLDPAAARAKALARLGDLDDPRRACRTLGTEMTQHPHGSLWFRGLRQDVRYALRVLRRAPLFTAAALLTMAIGIGANTAIFSVVDAVLLRGLPYPTSGRLVLIWNHYAHSLDHAAVSAAEFADIRDDNRVFDGVAAMTPAAANLSGDCSGCEPERASAYVVSPNLFALLGVQPRIGRPFGEADGQPDAEPVVMLGDALWRRRYGGDPDIVGRRITVNGRVRTVVGVMPPAVRFPDAPLDFLREPADLWTPLDWTVRRSEGRGNQYLGVIARLRPGRTMADARRDLEAIGDRFRTAYPDRYARPDVGWAMVAVSLRDEMVGDIRPALIALTGAVGLVLLIACANVANLMLVRGTTRRRELAVRSALGASRARLVRQLLIEAAVLTTAGAALGLGLAALGVRALVQLDPGSLPRLGDAGLNPAVLAYSMGLAGLTSVLVGLAPALRQSRLSPQAALGDGVRGSTGAPVRRRLRRLFVVAEVGMAIVVLVGAGLLVRSFAALERVSTGVDPSGTLVFELTLPRARYDTGGKMAGFDQRIAERLSALPGVVEASGVQPLPMSGENWSGSFFVEGQDVPPGKAEPHAEYAVALPGYFHVARIPLVAGRDFARTDTADSPPVVIVDQVLAARYWPREQAVGRRLNPNGPDGYWATVIGVVGHTRVAGPREAGEPQIYVPLTQRPQAPLYFLVRSAGAPLALAAAVRTTTHQLDPDLPITKLGTYDSLVARAVAPERLNALLFAVFGGVALALAAVGLYGVLAFLVAERRQEIGIRLALGGRPAQLVRRVLGEGLGMTLAGVVVGLAAALGVSRALSGLLFGVEATDPWTYAAIAALLTGVAAMASYLPARRATRVDPVEVLRH